MEGGRYVRVALEALWWRGRRRGVDSCALCSRSLVPGVRRGALLRGGQVRAWWV